MPALFRPGTGGVPSGGAYGSTYSGPVNLGGQPTDPAARRQQQQQIPFEEAKPSPAAAGAANVAAHRQAQATGAGYAVDPYGYTSFESSGEQGRITDTHQAKLQAEAEARRMASLSGLMRSQGGGTPSPRATHSGFGAGVSPEEFAQFKDTTGNITRGAVDSLRDLYAGTGNVGAQREGLEHIVQGGAGRLSDFARDQMIRAGQRREDISDQVYGGDITQRGQDMAQQQQMMSQLMGLFSQRY